MHLLIAKLLSASTTQCLLSMSYTVELIWCYFAYLCCEEKFVLFMYIVYILFIILISTIPEYSELLSPLVQMLWDLVKSPFLDSKHQISLISDIKNNGKAISRLDKISLLDT